jgi:hypothetical protein
MNQTQAKTTEIVDAQKALCLQHSVCYKLILTSLASDRPAGCFTGDDVFIAGVGFLLFSSGTTGIVVVTVAGRALVSTTVALCAGPDCGSTYVTKDTAMS